jgi:hypothetical protein
MMKENEDLFKDLCVFAKRALEGQTPKNLRAYSFAIDKHRKIILLRAHFAEPPSEDDMEDISVVETEIDADFVDEFVGETDVEVSPVGTPLSFLPGGIAYLREGEPGTCCS